MSKASGKRTYGVKLVRGPFVKLEPNVDAVEDEDSLHRLAARIRSRDPAALIGADLFSGAGGLTLGLEAAGIRMVFSVDHDAESVKTHRHHFGGLSVDWDLSDPAKVTKTGRLLKSLRIDVLAGGPPCQPFSKAGRSRIRHQVRDGLRDSHDQRRDLWQSYLEVVRICQPRAVIMENVPDMALDREMLILRTMVHELEEMGYSVATRVADTWRYGVPQFRQRLILVALTDRIRFDWPEEVPRKTSVSNAISDLPEVEGGWRPEGGADGWAPYSHPLTDFQRKMRAGVRAEDSDKVFDHITRPVRPDDARAFEMMDSRTRYSQLPTEVKRYRDDIFDDKYKRLDADDLSRTITAHIAKDGYWYIHPTQGRTLTVREAARLQTFPDDFRFSGPPSAAFRQIGNAVPPMFAEAIGIAVVDSLRCARAEDYWSGRRAQILANWVRANPPMGVPWLAAVSRWQAVSGELLLDRVPAETLRHVWPLVRRWHSPAETIAAEVQVREVGGWLGRKERAGRLLTLARSILRNGSDLTDRGLDNLTSLKVLPQICADIASLAVLDNGGSEEPVIVSKGTLRVVARIVGEPVDSRNKLTDGRLAVARVVGFGPDSREAHLALMEIASRICLTEEKLCFDCPVAEFCISSNAEAQRDQMLPLGQ